MHDLKRRFGTRLRGLRRQKGLTQEQLAEMANLSVDFISLIERGICAPSFESLEKLARALSVREKHLFDFEP